MLKTTAPTDSDSTPLHYLMWFRRDLRIHDNTALAAICARANADGAMVSAVFFITPEQWREQDTSVTQVDHITRTLSVLATALHKQLNITLHVYICPTFTACVNAITALCQRTPISLIMANHEYEGNESHRDHALRQQLTRHNIDVILHHDQCILPPKSITTNDGDSMYKVFTPFYNKWRETLSTGILNSYHAPSVNANKDKEPNYHSVALTMTLGGAIASAHTLDSIARLAAQASDDYQSGTKTHSPHNEGIDSPNYHAQREYARKTYPAGEVAACHRLDQFIAEDITHYNVSRDVPSLQATSQLSSYLAIGAISPRHCYLQAIKAENNLQGTDPNHEDINRWISELAWRDFYRHVLVDKPALIRHHAYKEEMDKKINWSYNDDEFRAWTLGKTGVPLVDAAMRCLNATGFMHNRLRMVTAMFLTKDLLIDWRWGERYFMQQLIDGDFASNNGGWQWSASTGTDAAPYFRIMNPFSQGKTHDPEAIFIKTWLPELKPIPATILHSEDKMRKELSKSGKFAMTDYPKPMVKHKEARLLAIAEFKNA